MANYFLRRGSVILLLAVGACRSGPSAPSEIPLAAISVFNPAEWQHWIDADGDCQDTRQEVLIEESLVAPTLDPRGCRVVSGMWRDEYTGAVFTDPGDLDIATVSPSRPLIDMADGPGILRGSVPTRTTFKTLRIWLP